MILSDTELRAVTKRDRPSAQARVLRLLGIPFKFHPTDGGLVVSTAAAEAVLSGKEPPVDLFSVNTEKLRSRGKTSRAHRS